MGDNQYQYQNQYPDQDPNQYPEQYQNQNQYPEYQEPNQYPEQYQQQDDYAYQQEQERYRQEQEQQRYQQEQQQQQYQPQQQQYQSQSPVNYAPPEITSASVLRKLLTLSPMVPSNTLSTLRTVPRFQLSVIPQGAPTAAPAPVPPLDNTRTSLPKESG